MSLTPTNQRDGALLSPPVVDQLREAFSRSRYTVDGLAATMGLAGTSALARADLAGAERLTRSGSERETLIRLFVLGMDVPQTLAARALAPLGIDDAVAAGVVRRSARGGILAEIDLRPYGEADAAGALPDPARSLDDPTISGPSWWVASDLGADVRPDAALRSDHVLGIGSAALTLAQATPRSPVARALDVGTGCGIQALHLSGHADAVVATDLSARALQMAATTARLNGMDWDLRQGDLLEPVQGELFDLIVANPPFVVGPGWRTPAREDPAADDPGGHQGAGDEPDPGDGFDYRDSGLAGDAVCESLVRGIPALLRPGGIGQLLANWIIPPDGDWVARLQSWLVGSGCDAWIWQRELAEPGEYVSLWLRDAGEQPGTLRWAQRYDAWMDWFAQAGVLGIGMGLITLRRTDSAVPTVICEDVPQAVQQPVGPHIESWLKRAHWLRERSGDGPIAGLGAVALRADDDLVLTSHALRGEDGWSEQVTLLRQAGGMRWELEVDAAISALVAGCDGTRTISELVEVLSVSVDADSDAVGEALAPVIVDLVRRGILLP